MNDLRRPTAAMASPAPQQSNLIDLRKIFMVVRRRILWILATVAIVFGLSLVAFQFAPRKYQATASVALDRQTRDLVASNNPNLATDSPSVDTEVQVLTSPRIAAGVVDRLGLEKVKGFGIPLEGPPAANPRDRAARAVRSGLSAKRQGVSYAIGVNFTHADRNIAPQVVNAVVDEYVSIQRGDKALERSEDTAVLGERLESLRVNVVAAEAAVAAYRGRTNLITVSRDSTINQQELSLLNSQLAQAKVEQAAARTKANSADARAAGLESEGLRSLRNQEATLSIERANLAGRYGELHPSLASVDRRLADVRASIEAEQSRVRTSVGNELRIADARVGSIQASLGRAQGALGAANSASVQLNELERNAESARVLYQSLLDRYNQAVTGAGTERSNAYIIARAQRPNKPVSPDRTLYLMGGLVGGVLAAAALVLLLEMLETGFQTRSEIEKALGLPLLASVPDLRTLPNTRINSRDPLAPVRYLVEHEGSLFGESFRSLRGSLASATRGNRAKTVMITSSLPAEGKTTIAMCLASSAALAGLKTVIVDCDLRRRSSSRAIADDIENGLVEVLKGEVALRDALVLDEASGAHVLAQRKTNDINYEIVGSKRMQSLINVLSESFDFVVLDTPPILALAEARAISAMVDQVVFVARWRKTPAQATQLALDQLGRAGANVAGIVLSQVNVKQQSRAAAGDEMVYYNVLKSYYAD